MMGPPNPQSGEALLNSITCSIEVKSIWDWACSVYYYIWETMRILEGFHFLDPLGGLGSSHEIP